MKKYMWTTLFSVSFIVCALLYLKYDEEGYYYGLGCCFCNEKMPYNLKPHDGSQFSFTLKDEDGFELIGKGFRFYSNSFTINNFLSYGYNDTSIITKVTDSLNNVKYLISYETKYNNKKGNPEISFRDIDDKYFEQVKDNYQWVELDEEKGNKIRFYRLLSFTGAITALLFLLWQLIRKRKATN